MRVADVSDHRDARARDLCKFANLAGVIHADLDDAHPCASAGSRNRESGTPMWLLKLPVVRPMRSRVDEQIGDDLFRGCLARAAGDGHDIAAPTSRAHAASFWQGAQRVIRLPRHRSARKRPPL